MILDVFKVGQKGLFYINYEEFKCLDSSLWCKYSRRFYINYEEFKLFFRRIIK